MSNPKIYIAGHNGMVGSTILKKLINEKNTNILVQSRNELDLTNQSAVQNFFRKEKPDQVYLAAAKVGGILANNNYPAEFIYENLMIETNIIHSAFLYGVKKLLFLGSSCIYPKFADQPMSENMLLKGHLEPTNEAYAIAKISGIKMCESYNRQYGTSHNIDYRSIMPTNLYGPGDNYKLEFSHVIPSLIRRFHEGKINNLENVTVWGSGSARREFLHVEDLANAAYYIMNLEKDYFYRNIDPMCSHVNVGAGKDITIKELAEEIKETVGYKGNILFDPNKPDGMPRKLLNSELIKNLGWESKINLTKGLDLTYKAYEVQLKENVPINIKKTISNSEPRFAKKYKYPLVKSSWDQDEHNAIKNTIASDNFTMGEKVSLFEKQFSEYIGSKYAVMSNSGSSANLLMVASLFYVKENNLKRGDEVIVPAVSWSTSYFPLYQYGLRLRFVDIDINTLNYNLDDLSKAINNKTRVILAVNLLGNPNDFSKILNMIDKRKIILIEDSCQAMGAVYEGKKAGTFGLMGTFSSFFSHHINTMEGGLTVTNNEELYQIMLSLRAHGWTRDLPKHNHICTKDDNQFKESFRFVLPGYNLRPLEFSGAIGIEQLKKLPALINMRRNNGIQLKEVLGNSANIQIQKEIGNSSWFGFSLVIKQDSKFNREELILKLNHCGFECRPISAGNFVSNDVLKYFDFEINTNLHNAEYIEKNGLVIGNNHKDMSEASYLLSDI